MEPQIKTMDKNVSIMFFNLQKNSRKPKVSNL